MLPVKRLTAALIPLALLLLVAGSALAANVKEIGDFADSPLPEAGCPANCQAIGHVSGYQVQIGTHKNPFLITEKGRIVAFSMKLGKPDAQQTQFFTNLFGGAPEARVTILKKPKKDKKKTNDLTVTQQSGLWHLQSYLGSSPTFALGKPLHVYPGAIVTITVPTWAPAFAINQGADQAWRSSRPKNDCNGTSQVAQQTVGTTTSYDCFYRTARLLYTVTFIPDPKPTTK